MNTRISLVRSVSIMLLLLVAMISCDRLANQKQEAFLPEEYNFTPSNISYGASINNGVRPRTFPLKAVLDGTEEAYSQAGGNEVRYTTAAIKAYSLSSNENGEIVNTGNGAPNISTPTDKNYYYDLTNNDVWFWNGEEWVLIGDGQIGSGDPDGNTNTNIRYYLNSDTNELWYWDGTQWVKVSGGEGDDNFATANSVGNGLARIHDIMGGTAIIKTEGNARSQLTVSPSFALGARLFSVDENTNRIGSVIASSTQSQVFWRDDTSQMLIGNGVADRSALISSTNTNTSTSNSIRVTPYRLEFATTAIKNSTAANGQVPVLYDASTGAWEWGTVSGGGGGGPVTWSSVTNKPAGFADNIDNVNDADFDPTNEIELPSGGNNGQVLSTNGNGVYSWVNNSTGGGGGGNSYTRFSLGKASVFGVSGQVNLSGGSTKTLTINDPNSIQSMVIVVDQGADYDAGATDFVLNIVDQSATTNTWDPATGTTHDLWIPFVDILDGGATTLNSKEAAVYGSGDVKFDNSPNSYISWNNSTITIRFSGAGFKAKSRNIIQINF